MRIHSTSTYAHYTHSPPEQDRHNQSRTNPNPSIAKVAVKVAKHRHHPSQPTQQSEIQLFCTHPDPTKKNTRLPIAPQF